MIRAAAILALLGYAIGGAGASLPAHEEQFEGRAVFVHVPARSGGPGKRPLVVVLHGGVANASSIVAAGAEHGLNLDAVADGNGFVVAYLSGTQAREGQEPDILSWNAGGGCCGQPARNETDDVAYLQRAILQITREYDVDPARVYGIGHSNGAMLAQRALCEKALFTAVVAVSGALNVPDADCGAARGRRVLAIHGADDTNVPIAGGRGGTGTPFASEAVARQRFERAGATYELRVVQGADHGLDHIGAVLQRERGESIALSAARFFGLAPRR